MFNNEEFNRSKNTYKSNKTIKTIKSNKSYKSKKIKDFRKSFLISKSLIKYNTFKSNQTKEKGSMIETQKLSNKNSSIYPHGYLRNTLKQINDSNNSISNMSSQGKIAYKKKRYSKKEKLFCGVFTNLTTTQEKSFQLNSSYDNINKISNNKYIKDINLQTKIKQVLISECSTVSAIKKKCTFLLPPLQLKNPSKSPKYSSKKKFKDFLSEAEFEKFAINESNITNNDKKSINKAMSSIAKSNEDIHLNIKKQSKNKILSSSKLIEINRNHRTPKKTKTPILESRKIKKKTTKKKPEKIIKQLNIISKNIQNTSKNINNPEEFYMNFFTNIIAKENKSINGDDNNNSKNILDFNSGEGNDENMSRKNSHQINRFDSLFSNNNSNVRDSILNINKIRNKSVLNSKI